MKNKLFNSIKLQKPRTNVFDLSQEKKLSMNMGDLVPIMMQEVVPGDKFRCSTESFVRFAPMVAPIMHRVNVYTHSFFVPTRILWDEWETFITGGTDGKQTPTFPKVMISSNSEVSPGSLADYLGLPCVKSTDTIGTPQFLNALPFRAYQKVYNEYFRDQTLTPEVAITSGSGNVTTEENTALLAMRKRSWEKDYFTSALPWSQRGGDVQMPTNVNYKPVGEQMFDGAGNPYPGDGGPVVTQTGGITSTVGGTNTPISVENVESLGTTINDLRRAVRLQEWLEKNARGGARYIEQILSHFGVRSSDARLQRPEYLGGGKQPVTISEVLSTWSSTEIPQGNMSGHGISAGSSGHFTKFFEEHGYVITLLSVLPRTSYQQGLPKIFYKFDKFDYFWPEFANIGEQEILTKELYLDWVNLANKDKVFGYAPRYAEYKFNNSSVHGDFKDNMSYWHMGRIFETEPALNASFIESDPTNRIFAVTDGQVHHLYVQLYNSIKAIRPMPVFGTPTL